MLENYNHDLIHQLSETLDSLWRYEEYMKNAQQCQHCQEVWRRCRELSEEMVEILTEEIKNHINQGLF